MEWPEVLGLVLGLIFVLFFIWALVYVFAIYLQEMKTYKKVHVLRFSLFTLKWIYGSAYFVICLFPTWVSVGFQAFHPKVRALGHKKAGVLARWMFRSTFHEPEVVGMENLPAIPEDKGRGKFEHDAVIYVVNHQSMIDIALFYFVERRFAWVSKSTVFTIPGVGWIMTMAQYIPLERGKGESIAKMFGLCRKSLGASPEGDNTKKADSFSVTIFPQGTRRRFELLPFKAGAFQLAMETGCRVVPITMYLPPDIWFNPSARGGDKCKLIVHKPMDPKDFKTMEAMREEAFKCVTSALPYAAEATEAYKKMVSEGESKKDK
eukprot:CAMPEP_0113937964 /NCGR_PEP_ID=MMETSP1339-20121228/4429_1 /TAXON_ID=94617 /ORGANISM="Fibrocapsa japonica" /LENGTH=319 /DNA_ID=CAMNT_0000940887 /DNA_START=110 /DNA_END=1069 /DNA_ORIENTATION=- /assembly_acc=CAM_ASM_000762